MKVVILCGGLAAAPPGESAPRPGPMAELGGRPLVWHVMKGCARAGFTEFVLALGPGGEAIKDWFLSFPARTSDFTVKLGRAPAVQYHQPAEEGWTVTLADTGRAAMSGARVKRVERYLVGEKEFLVAGSDAVADVDFKKLHAFHRAQGRIGTVVGVRPAVPRGQGGAGGDPQRTLAERPQVGGGRVNAGIYAFKSEFLNYLGSDDSCALEREPIDHLAEDGELAAFPHDGFWVSPGDGRDLELLDRLWASGQAPWKTWKD